MKSTNNVGFLGTNTLTITFDESDVDLIKKLAAIRRMSDEDTVRLILKYAFRPIERCQKCKKNQRISARSRAVVLRRDALCASDELICDPFEN